MKIKLITIGKTDEAYLKEGINKYVSRLKHYVDFETKELPDVKMGKKLNINLQKEVEGKEILKLIKKSDFVVLLDEKGKEFNSVGFSQFIQKRMNTGMDLIFVIGGPFGFSTEVYAQSNMRIALSQMTFSHQMVRLFFIEQIYRSFTILKGEKYHHL
ncbi:MAG: 23S rRNA (pseudouridine(1915)-N(3))-methyltransferase RlmH [Flavobacteriales bacterium]|nr:MAG: 23S rRNA (pseudouridine(1915)-N(3))-methyltransferase RlmH [Flavobacteriales bacterium]